MWRDGRLNSVPVHRPRPVPLSPPSSQSKSVLEILGDALSGVREGLTCVTLPRKVSDPGIHWRGETTGFDLYIMFVV